MVETFEPELPNKTAFRPFARRQRPVKATQVADTGPGLQRPFLVGAPLLTKPTKRLARTTDEDPSVKGRGLLATTSAAVLPVPRVKGSKTSTRPR